MWTEWLLLGLLGCGRAPSETSPAPVAPKTHVLIVVVDTLRADALSRADTPNLDALATAGDAVERAWAPGTWTVPSVISLFSGMPVRQHGWNGSPGLAKDFPKIGRMPLLAEVLTAHGFHATGLYANAFIDGDIGFSRGFDEYKPISDATAVSEVRKRIVQWTDADRQFLYVHLLGPHSPLNPSAEARAKHNLEDRWFEAPHGFLIGAAKRNREAGIRAAYEAAYLAVVEDTDARVGALIALLGDHRDDTLVIVTSDHGELIDDHGFCGHGHWVWEELTHVPFIVDGAGPLPSTLSTAALPDLVTSTVGITHTWPVTRNDTLPLVSEREGKVAVSHDGRFKGIYDDGLQVYDLAEDAEEASPLTGRDAGIQNAYKAWRDRYPPGTMGDNAVTLHPETLEALRSLGYLDAEATP
jgi:hypothetical protein